MGDRNFNGVRAWSGISENYSASAIVSCDPAQVPVFLDVRANSNTQYDWANFILSAIRLHYLQPGDILLMDNAAVMFEANR